MAQAILFASAYGVFFYIPMVYLPNWLNEHASFGLDRAMQINSLALLVAAPLVYLSALIGDRYLLRTHWITLSFGLVALAAWPLFELMQAGSLVAATLGQVLFIAMLAIPLGSAPAIFVELFPPVDRLTGYSISYNLGVGVIGGATPMAATWLIQQTGNSLSVAGMLVVAGALGVLAMLWIDDSSREDICQPAGQKCPVQC